MTFIRMGKVLKPGVLIKGTKDGLVFFLDDSRPFSAILNELKYKLMHNQASQIWEGPETKVKIQLGNRQISKHEEIALKELFSLRKNLIVSGIESEKKPYIAPSGTGIQMMSGTVRSGQVLTHQGDLLLLGDVNPGGTVQATGSIYILGALRGLAHAGIDGDRSVIIAASHFKPTQLRIADIISRPPDEWKDSDANMRFAYIVNQQIAVDQISHFPLIWPEKEWKEVVNAIDG